MAFTLLFIVYLYEIVQGSNNSMCGTVMCGYGMCTVSLVLSLVICLTAE